MCQPDYTLDMVLDFIQETAEAENKKAAESGHAHPRGILLTRFELLRILREKESPEVEKIGKR